MKRSKKKCENIVFVDRITVRFIFYLSIFRRSIQSVWFFDPMGAWARRVFRFLSFSKMVQFDARQIPHHMGEVRNPAGESLHPEIYRDIMDISKKIRKHHLENHPLFAAMNSLWEEEKVLFYFEKLTQLHVPGEIYMECMRIRMVEWMRRSREPMRSAAVTLYIQRKKWFSFIDAYAARYHVRLVGYKRLDCGNVPQMICWGVRLIKKIGNGSGLKKHFLGDRKTRGSKHAVPSLDESSLATIGICHSGGKLSLDPLDRSDFFWLHGTQIPFADLILYNCSNSKVASDGDVEKLRNAKVKILGNGPRMPAWRSTRLMAVVFLRSVLTLAVSVLRCLLFKRVWISPYFLTNLVVMAKDYAYWYDFFKSNGIRINVGILNRSVGQILALDALDGISVSYQYSISNFFPMSNLFAGETIQFYFSDTFRQIVSQVDPPTDLLVRTGFIHGIGLQHARRSERISRWKKQFSENGVRFVICYFDENTIDRWDLPFPSSDAAVDHEFLFNWLLSDSTLGLVLKPKRALTLIDRLSKVSDLLEAAVKTGRCLLQLGKNVDGNIYPAEVACLADVCIGRLRGGTAAFEARLAGVPTLLIDNERLRDHPFYRWGGQSVVFESWQAVRSEVEVHRNSAVKDRLFGDWSPGLKELDPFQDGLGSFRMGMFVHWLHDAIKQGMSKKAATHAAREEYSRQWGGAHITGKETHFQPGAEYEPGLLNNRASTCPLSQ